MATVNAMFNTCSVCYSTARISNELPSDLIYNIIESIDDRGDELNNDSNRFPSTLTACSLVSHAWNDVCRPHIFRTITIDHGAKWHSRLSFLYFTAPHLSKHIRTLRLSWDSEIHTAAEWIPACLKQLENLDGLYLRSHLVPSAPTVPMPFALGVITLAAHIKRLWLETWDVVKDASDLLPLLSACSATLEKLTLRIYSVSHLGTIPQRQDFQSKRSKPVRLEALRKLELLEGFDPLPQMINIECPNLESLTVELDGGDRWEIPSWIPAGFHELNLRVAVGIDVPLLQSTHLSSLSITISHAVDHSYHPVITWIGTFLRDLPFPEHLRQLTVKIDSYSRGLVRPIYPCLAEYEELYQVLETLLQYKGITRLNLIIAITLVPGLDVCAGDEEGEIAKLGKAFRQLLASGILAADIISQRPSGEELGRWCIGPQHLGI